jgi:hypothetical protein
MTTVLAIDPGNTESGWVITDHEHRPVQFGKTENAVLLEMIQTGHFVYDGDVTVIEMIASYGMAVGADVFETCVWIGRFQQALIDQGAQPELIKRHPVKMHHCHNTKAKDSNITQALVDRFAPGQRNHGKGTKADPGWFYGFAADVWQAYALAVYAADIRTGALV